MKNKIKIRFPKKNSQNSIYSKNYLNKSIYGAALYLILILSVFINGGKNTVQAKELAKDSLAVEIKKCNPVDLVFVVDQSEEMSSLDPNNMRFDSIKWLFNFLGFDSLLNCPSITHRVALISFSDAFSVDIGLTSINPDLNSFDPWSDWAIKYDELIAPIHIDNANNRNSYSLQNALEKATKLLIEAPTIGTDERNKAIVLIMGGGGSICADTSCNIYDVKQEQRDLSQTLNNNMDLGISFWGVIYGTDYKYESQNFWENAVADKSHIFIEKGGVTVGRELKNIFLSLSPRSDVREVCGSLYMEPFLDKAVFNVLLDSREKDIKIQSDLGGSKTLTSSKNTNGAMNSSVKTLYYPYDHPEPGRWEVTADCNNNKALVVIQIAYSEKISIIEPSETLPQYKEEDLYFDPENEQHLKIQVLDARGIAIKGYASYQATITGEVKTPDEEEYGLTFKYDDLKDIYISEEALPVNENGDYEVSIDWQIPSADPSLSGQYVSTIHLEDKYTVEPVTPFVLQIESPTFSSHVPVHGNLFNNLLEVRPIDIKVRLKLRGSDDHDDQVLLGDPKQTIKAVLYFPSSQSTEVIWLEPSSTDPLIFVGKNKNIVSSGDYSMKVSFEGQYDAKKFRLAQNPAGDRTEFHRADGLLETPQFYYLLAFILAIIAIWFAWQEVWKRTNLAKGYLLFIPPGLEMKPFAVLELGEQKRRKVIYDKEALIAKSWLLSNLKFITVDNPNLFGGAQKINISEEVAGTEIPVEIPVDKDSNKILLTTSAAYKIMYSVEHSQDIDKIDQIKK